MMFPVSQLQHICHAEVFACRGDDEHASHLLLSSHQSAQFYSFVLFFFCYYGLFFVRRHVLNSHSNGAAAAEVSDAQQWPSVYHSRRINHMKYFFCQSSASRPVQTHINQEVASPLLGWFFIITFRCSHRKVGNVPLRGPFFLWTKGIKPF